MTRVHSLALLGLIGFLSQNRAFAGVSEKAPVSSQAIAARSSMPAVRRIGILAAHTNVVAFREFMRDESRNLGGFLSLPITDDQVSREVSQMVSRAVNNSGRFWSLSMDALVELSGVSPLPARDYSAAELRLYKAYDLDAWIEPELTFSPDHTKMHLTLRSAKDRSFVLAREDILFEPMPSSAEVERNVHSALARIAATLGHDGRITWRKNDLVVVDFGKERGVAQGTQLGAGYVILSAHHPVSQEYIRTQKIQTLELEVIEAREGSSVCRIVRRHPLLETEANNLLPGLTEKGLLAWRTDSGANTGWMEFNAPQSPEQSIISGSETGFHSDEKPLTVPPPTTPTPPSAAQQAAAQQNTVQSDVANAPAGASPLATTSAPTKAPTAATTPTEGNEQTGTQDAQEAKEAKDSKDSQERAPVAESNASTNPLDEFAGLLEFSRWKPREAFVGLAIAGGTLQSTSGSLTTDFPSTVFNSILAGALIRYSNSIYLEPEAFFHSFSGTVNGTRAEISAPLSYVTMGNKERPGQGTLSISVGPTILFGEVKSTRIVSGKQRTTTQTFSAIDVSLQGNYAMEIPAFGEASAQAGVAIGEVLKGDGSALELRTQAHPSHYVPKELGFYAGYRMGPGIWTGWNIGANWSFKL